MKQQDSKLRRFTSHSLPRYLVTGGAMSLLDWGLFTTFSVALSFPAVLANICSTVITICVSYFLNQRFVFKAKKASWRSFFSFSGLTLFTGLVLQSLVILGVLKLLVVFQSEPLPAFAAPGAKIIAMGVGATCNYLGYKYLFTRNG
ncbi:MAG: GtrA family protein [Varibaculum cambriense]|uniref:GtrA family protein n=1 Tax=Varibaculum cambriense TaxID=184870 RepID=UPI002915BE8F|nr:GtrA family protein [Varibaculum cambriense]MDU6681377.1 GtrA family protein [Varibaculum cambriense]